MTARDVSSALGKWTFVAALLPAAVAAFSCGDVTPAPSPSQPFNSCPSNACTAYQQTGNAPTCTACLATSPKSCSQKCAVNDVTFANSSQFFLVVDLPESSFFAAGSSFVVSGADVAASPTSLSSCTTGNCVTLPALASAEGALVVDYATAMQAGFYLGNGPAFATTLPVGLSFRPLLPVGTTPTLEDATMSGIILQSPIARPLSKMANPTAPINGLTPIGPYGSTLFGYGANVAPGTYAVVVSPAAPFDQVFPPFFENATYGIENLIDRHLLTVDDPTAARTTVVSAEPLDGYVAYLRDQSTHVRVSSQVPLSGLTTNVQLHTSGQLDPTSTSGDLRTKLEFVVAPSAALAASGAAAVVLADGVLAGTITSQEVYPPLPSPVDVEGQVLDPSGDAVVATLAITSTGISRLDRPGLDTTLLSYATGVTTDAAGNYKVSLPPGQYSVTVTPAVSDSSNRAEASDAGAVATAATTVTTLDVAASVPVQAGKTLTTQATVHLKGNCIVADGRALAAATIEATAAASLVSTPGTLPPPRSFSVATALDGSFDMLVDPGVYDLTVKPATGSNLPWLVSASVLVPPSTGLAVATQVVPAPIVADYTFSEPTNLTLVPNALIRAYAYPAGSTVAVEVANGITDAKGQVELLLAGTPL